MPLQAKRSLKLEDVVPEISNISNKHIEVVKNDYPHLRDLWFSDVCQTKEELIIDLLIGSNYLWEFQKGQTILVLTPELIEVEGTLISWQLTYDYQEEGEEILISSHLMFGQRMKTTSDKIIEDEEEGESRYTKSFRYIWVLG